MLLLAGDLTRHGTLEEGRVVADEFRDLPSRSSPCSATTTTTPTAQREIAADAARRRDRRSCTTTRRCSTSTEHGSAWSAARASAAGFAGKCASEFGEPEIKAFVGHTKRIADRWRGRAEGARGRPPGRARRTTRRSRTPWRASRWRSIPSSAATCWPRRSTRTGADLIIHGHAHAGSGEGHDARRDPGAQRGAAGARPGVRGVLPLAFRKRDRSPALRGLPPAPWSPLPVGIWSVPSPALFDGSALSRSLPCMVAT